MDSGDKQRVVGLLEPVLRQLLEGASPGLEKETGDLLHELGVYDLPYERLEAMYLSEIRDGKAPGLLRSLILRDHHAKVPRLRAALMSLHMESDDSTRSIISGELPHIR